MLSQEKPRDFRPIQLQPQSRKDQNDDNDDGEVVEVKHDEFLDHALEVLEQDDHHEVLDVQNLLGKHQQPQLELSTSSSSSLSCLSFCRDLMPQRRSLQL